METEPTDETRRSLAARARLGLAVALGIALALLLSVITADSLRLVGEPFPGFVVWDNGMLVSFHTPGWTGAVAGLPLNGGRVIAIDGRPFVDGRDLLATAAARPPGTSITYRIVGPDGERDFVVPTMRLSWSQYLLTVGNYLVNAAFCFVVAVIALALRPDHPPARALFLSMLNLGLLLALAVDYLMSYRFVAFCQLVEATVPAATLSLALVFPVERMVASRRKIAVPLLFLAALSVGIVNAAFFYERPDVARDAWRIANVLTAAAGGALLVSFSHALLKASAAEERLRAAIVFAGGMVAFLLPAVAIFAFSMLGWAFSLTWATGLFFVFPVSIFYAIMRYDLLGAERFIRLAMGYAVATATIVLAYATGLLAVERLLAPTAPSSPAIAFVLLLGIALCFDPLRRRVQKAVDRVFFRSSIEAGSILEASGVALATLHDEPGIVRSVGELLCEALSLQWARLVPLDTEEPQAALVESVVFDGEELAHLACGPKLSGAPFSSAERELVRGVAAQAALALRNAGSIQALRETQESLLRAQRLAVIGEFAAAVAHGIRNPLSGIRAAAQIALEQSQDTAVSETLTGVLGESDRLEQRVRNLLDFSRPYEVEIRSVDVRAVLETVRVTVAGQAQRQGVKLSLVGSETCPVLESDPDYLEEALLELAGNALQAMPNGGELRLEVGSEDERVVILVSDSGTGIPAGVQDRVFELFFTTRTDGTGMGLATVKKVVANLGGTVELASSTGEGTTFRIELG